MKRCECGAKWRINWPHGKRSKSITTFLVKHRHKCKYSGNYNNDL